MVAIRLVTLAKLQRIAASDRRTIGAVIDVLADEHIRRRFDCVRGNGKNQKPR